VILAVLIAISAIILLFKSAELTFFYPLTFGLAGVLCILFAIERLIAVRGHEKKEGSGILFLIGAVAFAFFTYASIKVVF